MEIDHQIEKVLSFNRLIFLAKLLWFKISRNKTLPVPVAVPFSLLFFFPFYLSIMSCFSLSKREITESGHKIARSQRKRPLYLCKGEIRFHLMQFHTIEMQVSKYTVELSSYFLIISLYDDYVLTKERTSKSVNKNAYIQFGLHFYYE